MNYGVITCQLCDSVLRYQVYSEETDTDDMSRVMIDHLIDDHGWKLDDILVERGVNEQA